MMPWQCAARRPTERAGAPKFRMTIDLSWPGIRLLGKLIARFDSVSYLYEPLADGAADKCYISQSYDATSHDVAIPKGIPY